MTNRLITIIFFCMSFQASATSVKQQLVDCLQIVKDPMRLTCFDTLAGTIDLTALNTTQGKIKPVIAESAAIPQEIFGFEAKAMTSGPEKIAATIKSLRKTPHGYYIISLYNGQVWQQKDSSGFRLATDDVIYIKKGALGSFWLGREGRNRKIRVKRNK